MNFHHQGQNAVGQVDQGNEPPANKAGKSIRPTQTKGLGRICPG